MLDAKSRFDLLGKAKISRCVEMRKPKMEKKRRRRPARTGMPSNYIGKPVALSPSSLNPF
jgi:hypothetical protein